MKKTLMLICFIAVACSLATWPTPARAQGGYDAITGDAFNHAIPADFYLEGNHIPVEKRNAVFLKNAAGARVVFGLLDTTGYSSQIQQKYVGMLITETKIAVCGNAHRSRQLRLWVGTPRSYQHRQRSVPYLESGRRKSGGMCRQKRRRGETT